MSEKKNRILVIRGGAIGDFILTLPVFRALRETFPETRLEVLGYPRIAELAYWGGWVEAVRSLEARPVAYFFARNGDLDAGWAEYFDSFAIIISYLFDPDGIFQQNVGRVSGAQFLSGLHRPLEDGGEHATDVLLKPLERLAVFGADPVPRLQREVVEGTEVLSGETRALRAWVKEGRTLVFHPGSGGARKNWDETRWRHLLGRVLERGTHRILLVGGEAEGDRLAGMMLGGAGERVRMARGLPLTELAAVMEGCEGMVGHDSGISHLAASLGKKTLVLWGPTVREVWQPRGPEVRILQHASGLAGLTVESVEPALWAMVGSPPV